MDNAFVKAEAAIQQADALLEGAIEGLSYALEEAEREGAYEAHQFGEALRARLERYRAAGVPRSPHAGGVI